jgi:hypothetical protein
MKKNILKSMIVCMFAAMTVSCEDEIDLAPISQASTVSFYKNQSQFETAIISVYRDWLELYTRLMTEYTEFRGDTFFSTGYLYNMLITNVFTNDDVQGMWNACYKLITDANVILDRIEAVEFQDQTVKNRIMGEARFGRAHAYFILIRLYGRVPLVTHEITSKEALTMGRAPMDEILQVIEDDYKFAIANVLQEAKWDDTYGRFTKYAAEGELARFYITVSGKMFNKNRWADAKPLMEDILNNSPFEFLPTFAEMFAQDGSGERNKEVILNAAFKGGTGGIDTNYATQMDDKSLQAGVEESFETGDLRKDASIAQHWKLDGSVQFAYVGCIKFHWGWDMSTSTSGQDMYVLRYTDVQLMYAETLAEIAGSVPAQALNLFNKSRVRAGLTALTAAEVPNIAAFRLAMEKERRSELMFENVRWFDLLRTGRAVDALRAVPGRNADDTWLLLPIPQIEIDKIGNKDLMWQNPGYPGA